MMLEEQLENRLFLNKAGAFSIKRGSRSVVESLHYASTLLHDEENMVAVYPQGTITSVHRRPVRFEKGAERIIAGASDKLMILFYVALPDWYSEKRPGLTVRVIEYGVRERSATDLEEVYNTERHLLYVACTRARDNLLITGVDPASEFLDDLRKA